VSVLRSPCAFLASSTIFWFHPSPVGGDHAKCQFPWICQLVVWGAEVSHNVIFFLTVFKRNQLGSGLVFLPVTQPVNFLNVAILHNSMLNTQSDKSFTKIMSYCFLSDTLSVFFGNPVQNYILLSAFQIFFFNCFSNNFFFDCMLYQLLVCWAIVFPWYTRRCSRLHLAF